MSSPLLAVDGLTIRFGGITAVDQVSLSVDEGELVGLIGPNGAGKTTLFEAVSGLLAPSAGRIRLDDQDVTAVPAHGRARMGVSRGFQDARLYPAMTVVEVLQVALERHLVGRTDLAGELLGLPSARRVERWAARRANDAVERFGLAGFGDRTVAQLSTGTRRVLELAAVLAPEPRLVLLDEPTAGIASQEAEALAELIARLRAETGVTVLLIEHDVPMVMALADRVHVMEAGRTICEGTPEQVRADAAVGAAYLGIVPAGGEP